MAIQKFTIWLNKELTQKGWSQADLARHSGLSTAAISRIMNGTRNAGPELCQAIARALHLPPEVVYRKAGLLPPEEEPNLEEKIILNIYKKLTPARQEDMRGFAEYQLQVQEQKGEYNV